MKGESVKSNTVTIAILIGITSSALLGCGTSDSASDSFESADASSSSGVEVGACTTVGPYSTANYGEVVPCTAHSAVGKIFSEGEENCGPGYVTPDGSSNLEIASIEGETVCVEEGPVSPQEEAENYSPSE